MLSLLLTSSRCFVLLGQHPLCKRASSKRDNAKRSNGKGFTMLITSEMSRGFICWSSAVSVANEGEELISNNLHKQSKTTQTLMNNNNRTKHKNKHAYQGLRVSSNNTSKPNSSNDETHEPTAGSTATNEDKTSEQTRSHNSVVSYPCVFNRDHNEDNESFGPPSVACDCENELTSGLSLHTMRTITEKTSQTTHKTEKNTQ